MGNKNDCCCYNSSQLKPESQCDQLIIQILKAFPLTKYSSSHVLSKFQYCKKEIKDNTSIDGVIVEYSEEKYVSLVADLFSISNSEVKSVERRKSKKMPTNKNLDMAKLQSSSSSKMILSGSTKRIISYATDNISNEHCLIDLLYLSIVPDYYSLFETYSKNPKCNFLLFIIGFTKENINEKSESIIDILSYHSLPHTIESIKTILMYYIMINYSFSTKIMSFIMKNYSQSLCLELKKAFSIQISKVDLFDWQENNDKYAKIRSRSAEKVVNRLVSDLSNELSLCKNKKVEEEEKTFDEKKGKGLVSRYVEKEDLVVLFQKHDYLFDQVRLNQVLNDYLEVEWKKKEKYEKKITSGFYAN